MSFLGFLGKAIGVATSIIPGSGIVKAAIGGVGSLIGGGGGGVTGSSAMPRTTLGGQFRTLTSGAVPMRPSPFSAFPAGAGTTTPAPGPSPVSGHPGNGKCDQIGHHLNKSRYYREHGVGLFGGGMVEKGTLCVKNRSMNVGNTRALRRALRRAYGFEKLAMRTIRLLHPKKRASFGGFKRARAKR